MVRAERHELRIGPLPEAEELERYNAVVPGSAERIIKMAEKEQAHSHAMGRKKHVAAIAGMITSILLGLSAVGVCYYMIYSKIEGIDNVMYSIAAVLGVAVGGRLYLQAKKQGAPGR